VARRTRKVKPTAKILTLSLSEALHLRFLKEAQAFDGDGNGDKEKFLFVLMEKYLSLSIKKLPTSKHK
jgi:hypothetical protein